MSTGPRFDGVRRRLLRMLAVACLAWAALLASDLRASPPPQFRLAPERGIVAGFAGYGVQLNQHVYAEISGPPPDLAGLEAKLTALRPQVVRVFFNSSEWTYPDRMASFVRTVQLAQRSDAQIDITWQGGGYAASIASMPRFAAVLADLLQDDGIGSVWVTLFNEPNSTRLTLPQYESVYRLLDTELQRLGVRDRARFMGGDLVGTTSPLGQSQTDWFRYMATRMSDLLDAWSVHVYWDLWDTPKIERRLQAEVCTIFGAIPAELRRPLYVTEFGVRGLRTIEGEPNIEPGLAPDGTPLEQSTSAAFQEAWLTIRATQLGFSGIVKWDGYGAKYDKGSQDYSAIGPGAAGWPLRPSYHLLRLLTATTSPRGGRIVEVVPGPGAEASQLLTAYLSPGGNVTVLGLDTRGGAVGGGADDQPVPYSVAGLPPNTLFRLILWNGKGDGTNVDIGYLDSGPSGTLGFSAPLNSVFALTSTWIGSLPS